VRDFLRRLHVDVSDEDDLPMPLEYLVSTIANPWLTDTETGNFIPELMKVLRAAVVEEVRTMQKDLRNAES
jgi:hypothetical protein